MTLNDQGYVATFVDGSNTYEYTYDENGYMTKAEKNGNIASNITIENGNITQWTRFSDGVEQFKVQTYSAVPNVGGAHCIYAEGSGLSRWLVETGLFGKASANCHTVAAGSIHPLHLLTHSNMMKIVVSKKKARTMTEILRNSIIHISPNNIL